MNTFFRSLTFPVTAAVGLASVIGLGASPSHAVQTSLPLNITVQLSRSVITNTGLCRSSNRIGSFGETITVICSTGKQVNFRSNTSALPWTAIQDGPFRFVTVLSKAGEPKGMVDSYTGFGTITSWRVVSLKDIDYLEMTVHW